MIVCVDCGRPLPDTHAFRGHHALLDHKPFLVQDHLVGFIRRRRLDRRRGPVGVGDRLVLEPHLFATDRDRLGDHLGDDVLAQAHPCARTPHRAHVQLLFGARHGAVRGWRRISPQAVVTEQLGLLRRGEGGVSLHHGRGLDLLLGDLHLNVLTRGAGRPDRNEGRPPAEQTPVHQGPFGHVGLGIEIDLIDLPDPLAVRIQNGASVPVVGLGHLRHQRPTAPRGGWCRPPRLEPGDLAAAELAQQLGGIDAELGQ